MSRDRDRFDWQLLLMFLACGSLSWWLAALIAEALQ